MLKKDSTNNPKNIISVDQVVGKNEGYYLADKFILRSDTVVDSQYIPLYELDAFAGLVATTVEERKPEDFVYIENIPHCDGAMHVKGDSMYPLLQNGDTVLYKTTKSRRGGLNFGNMYVVAYIEDGEEHLVIKYVDESDADGCYILRSHNPKYKPKKIPRDCVVAMGLVKATIRFHAMG